MCHRGEIIRWLSNVKRGHLGHRRIKNTESFNFQLLRPYTWPDKTKHQTTTIVFLSLLGVCVSGRQMQCVGQMDCFNVFHCNLHSLCHLSCLIMIVAEGARTDKLFVSLCISFSPALSSLMWHLSLCLFLLVYLILAGYPACCTKSLWQWLCGCRRSTTKPINTEWVAMWTLLICLLAGDSYAKPTPCSYTLTRRAMR